MLTEATAANLKRKAHWADHVQMHDGRPLFSWLELNPTELCDLACPFCPRSDAKAYPNQRLHMALPLAGKIAEELRGLDYSGVVVLSGFGEPLLHPRIVDLVGCFGAGIRVEIVTNGNRLTPSLARDLAASGADFFAVSLYDGPHQVETLSAMFAAAGIGPDSYVLRDRWHREEDDWGLKLTNRAGAVTAGRQEAPDPARPCRYPAYQMTVDWNGDVLLCPQDWSRRLRFGNAMHDRLADLWNGKALHKRRMRLLGARAGLSPCEGCNTDACLHGAGHALAWQDAGRARP